MSKATYIPMPGAGINASQAQIIGKTLDIITKENGCIKPEAVVTKARPKTSPLHPHFTWDDSKAAEAYRIDEARQLIRSVRIIRTEMPAAEQPIIRAFVNVKASDKEYKFEGQGYIPVRVAAKSDDYRQQILNAAKAELRHWQQKYADLEKELSGVFEAIEELV